MSFMFTGEKFDKTRQLADAIKNGVTIDKSDPTFTKAEETEKGSVYMGNLPEGLTPELVKAKASYDAHFLKAVNHASGEIAAEAFLASKDVAKASVSVGYAEPNGSVTVVVNPKSTYKNSFAKEGEPNEITKHLTMLMTVDTVQQTGHGLKPLRTEMGEQFANRFAK